MTKKPTVQYRLVCAKHGVDRGHSTHAYPKSTLAKATQAVIDADHQSEMLSARSTSDAQRAGDYYGGEAPWRVQRREVSVWEDSYE